MTFYHVLAHRKADLREAKDHEQTVRAICEHTTETHGKTVEDRKRELSIALSQSSVYGSALRQLREAEQAVDMAQADVEQEEAERREREWQIRARLAEALGGRNEDDLSGHIQDRQMEQSARLRIVQSTHQSVDDLYGEESKAIPVTANLRELYKPNPREF